MTVPWRQNTKPEYQKQEQRTAKKTGARAQINSGRLWSSLRDVSWDISLIGRLLIDNKSGRDGPVKSYRLTVAEWNALKRDANRTPPGCYPGLQIDLGPHRLLVIEEDMMDEIARVLNGLHSEP